MILFLTGTISEYLSKKGEGHFAYDFGLLSGSSRLSPCQVNPKADILLRRCRTHLRLHVRNPTGTVAHSPLPRSRVSKPTRDTLPIRLCKSDLDPSRADLVEPRDGTELRIRSHRFCVLSLLLDPKSISCSECNEVKDVEGTVDSGHPSACWLGCCNQGSFLCS
jgi:hypothetical protein